MAIAKATSILKPFFTIPPAMPIANYSTKKGWPTSQLKLLDWRVKLSSSRICMNHHSIHSSTKNLITKRKPTLQVIAKRKTINILTSQQIPSIWHTNLIKDKLKSATLSNHPSATKWRWKDETIYRLKDSYRNHVGYITAKSVCLCNRVKVSDLGRS